ncbi:DUF2971 domain-containing protein [Rhizobium ruizarguesonis]|uniref:DUF2971 domain-containing protein n=1 Tax=Rhizobium ruizarguesonis TaxID=2081791 RepID=UPI0037209784
MPIFLRKNMDPLSRLDLTFFGDETDGLRKQFFTDQTLVHYTTAENALNILKGEVWLRNTRVMNDVAEVQYGASLIERAIGSGSSSEVEPALLRLGNLLDRAHPGLSDEVYANFRRNLGNLVHRTYVTCLSVHHPKKEENGRLSMWRAYTGNYAGVALVLNPEPFTQMVEDPSFFSVPVSYATEHELQQKLIKASADVEQSLSLVAEQPRYLIAWYFGTLLRKIATASKHHGFREEEEWRVMHTRYVDPSDGLRYEIATVRGIPQLITKLSIGADGPFADKGITIPNLVRQVIIGPTNYPYVVAEAVQAAMETAGIVDAASKIHISQIPLRMEPS